MLIEITHLGSGRRYPFGARQAGDKVTGDDVIGHQLVSQGFAVVAVEVAKKPATKAMVETQPAKAAVMEDKVDG